MIDADVEEQQHDHHARTGPDATVPGARIVMDNNDPAEQIRRVGVSIEETALVSQIFGLTASEAADALQRFADEFHPEKLVHDLAPSFSPTEWFDLQERVRASMRAAPDASFTELLLEHGAAIERER